MIPQRNHSRDRSHQLNIKRNMKYLLNLSVILIFNIFHSNLSACTIFCASSTEKKLMAGNEDWQGPFSKIWVHEISKDNYGVLYIGHSDYQVQFGINEYGLALDFAAIAKIEGTNLEEKKDLDKDLSTTILTKCKTVKEALFYLENYKYQSPYHQMLLFDANGESLIVNQDGIIKRKENFQITTNYNHCIHEKKNNCERYAIVKSTMSQKSKISVPLFRELLSRTHQEDDNPTQYSYLVDATVGKLHLYSFHNYENEVVLDYKEVIKKGFMMKSLKQMFPDNYAEMAFRSHHKDTLKQTYIKRLYKEDTQAIINSYETMVKSKPEISNYPFLLLDISFALINEILIQENNGKPFDYWYYPSEEDLEFETQNHLLYKVLDLLTYLENVPKEDPKQNIGTFEFKGLIYSLLGKKVMAKKYFNKTIEVSPEGIGNYNRSKLFLEHLDSKERNIKN